MTITLRTDLTVPTLDTPGRDPGHVDNGLHLALGHGRADVSVSTPIAVVAVHVGLDRVLNSHSGIDHLLNGPDPLARFRAGAVPADPSPIATRGMTVRQGDPYVEVATRYAVGAVSVTLPAVRAEFAARTPHGLLAARVDVGADTRGVGAVRDPVAAAGLAVRIDGPGGTTAAQGGITAGGGTGSPAAVQLQGGPATLVSSPAALTALAHGGTITISFAGLADIFGVAAVVPREAPPGALLVYARTDGATVVELRVASGFAGLNATQPVPVTGAPDARADPAHTLTGVLVPREGGLPPSPFILAAAGAAVAAGAPPPPDGSNIPAGHPAVPTEPGASFGEASANPDGSDRPYLHALWYDILALRFADAGITLGERSAVLRDAVWATAMEHGPFANATGTDVLSQLAQTVDLAKASDATILAALFAERARADADGNLVHFPEVLPFDRTRVTERLGDEAKVALDRLAA